MINNRIKTIKKIANGTIKTENKKFRILFLKLGFGNLLIIIFDTFIYTLFRRIADNGLGLCAGGEFEKRQFKFSTNAE